MRLRLLLAFVACCLARQARADAIPLAWEAVAGCPDEAAARAAVERSLGALDVGALRALRARVTRVDDVYELSLWLDTGAGIQHKWFRASLCSTFVALVALELRLASAPKRVDPAPAAAPDTAAPRAELGWELQLIALVGTGPPPQPAFGAALGVGLSWRQLRVELQPEYWGAQPIAYTEAPEVKLRFDLFGLNLRSCYVVRWQRVELPLCIGAEPGLLRGSARGVDEAQPALRPWLALAAATPVRVRIASRVWLWLEASLGWAVVRSSFGVQNLPTLYTPPALNVRSGLGVGFNFD